MIKFNKVEGAAELYSPLKNFELDSQPIEYREDPLTGLTSVIRTGREFWGDLFATDENLLAELAETTRERCFFCPDKVTTTTPKFTSDLFPEGRVNLGDAWLFPNLFAQKEYSAIATLTAEHYLPLDRFNPDVLLRGFKLAATYIRRVHEVKGTRYAEVGGNYLYPGGASIMHPHIQIMCSNGAYYLLKIALEKGKEHYEHYSLNFWEELMETEKKLGERYLGAIGDTEWFTPYAAIREDEVNAVVRGKSNFLEFDDDTWRSLAEGLSLVLKGYSEEKLSCFNWAVYSGPLGEKLDYFWAGLKIVARTSVQPYPVSDLWYSCNILLDGFVTRPPEAVAASLRKYFWP